MTPATLVDDIQWTKSVQLSELAECDADHIIVNIGKDAISQATWANQSSQASWHGLKAVKKGQVHWTSGYAGWESPWNEHTAFNHDRFLGQFAQIIHPAT
ncbi:hypothetical protein [Paenibacillus qinlingensis]|uniref:ABC-type Fe3+-citrate transport system substrate-binding protein n=1 Tax=Paenibacillus qinlingensis TaxID=1837343 RepID=A0ABU1NQ30_9BACL|nr:hypothetical protein [Paenibacillus qinlingensis]MDR6549588.1 ABC-type Fe3+-citrate transport system substrate-binding protein [Paenibacillus qinlingensis]